MWGKPSKSGKDWNEQAGRLATLSKEERTAIAKKGAAVSAERRTARAKMKKMLSEPDKFREEAIEAILEVDPNAMDALAKTIYQKAIEGDKFCIDMLSKMFSIEAPKKAELTVKEEMSKEEALKILRDSQIIND